MTDAANKPQTGIDKHVQGKGPEHPSWAANFAASVWNAGSNAEKAAENIASGVVNEAREHPVATAVGLVAGVALIAVAPEVIAGMGAAEFLPPLSLSFAGGAEGGAMAMAASPSMVAGTAAIGAAALLEAGKLGMTISMRSRDTEPTYESQNEFINGVKTKLGSAEAGFNQKVLDEIPNADKIISQGGMKGNLKFTDTGDGYILIKTVAGPRAGNEVLYNRASKTALIGNELVQLH